MHHRDTTPAHTCTHVVRRRVRRHPPHFISRRRRRGSQRHDARRDHERVPTGSTHWSSAHRTTVPPRTCALRSDAGRPGRIEERGRGRHAVRHVGRPPARVTLRAPRSNQLSSARGAHGSACAAQRRPLGAAPRRPAPPRARPQTRGGAPHAHNWTTPARIQTQPDLLNLTALWARVTQRRCRCCAASLATAKASARSTRRNVCTPAGAFRRVSLAAAGSARVCVAARPTPAACHGCAGGARGGCGRRRAPAAAGGARLRAARRCCGGLRTTRRCMRRAVDGGRAAAATLPRGRGCRRHAPPRSAAPPRGGRPLLPRGVAQVPAAGAP